MTIKIIMIKKNTSESDFYGNIFGASYAKSKIDRGTKNLAVGTRMYL